MSQRERLVIASHGQVIVRQMYRSLATVFRGFFGFMEKKLNNKHTGRLDSPLIYNTFRGLQFFSALDM